MEPKKNISKDENRVEKAYESYSIEVDNLLPIEEISNRLDKNNQQYDVEMSNMIAQHWIKSIDKKKYPQDENKIQKEFDYVSDCILKGKTDFVEEILNKFFHKHHLPLPPTQENFNLIKQSFAIAKLCFLRYILSLHYNSKSKIEFKITIPIIHKTIEVNVTHITKGHLFTNLAEEYLSQPRIRCKGYDTHKIMRSKISTFQKIVGTKKTIENTTQTELEDALNQIPYLTKSFAHNHKLTPQASIRYGKSNLKDCITDKTLNEYLFRIKQLYDYAMKKRYIKINEYDACTLPISVNSNKLSSTTQRKPFTTTQLQAIFKMPLYTGCDRNKRAFYKVHGNDIVKDEYYWLPLLALYTGARVEELSQLEVDDIKNEKGIDYIDINDLNGKKLKNINAKRKIPLHSLLIKIGFLDYVIDLRNKHEFKLFSNLDPSKNAKHRSASNISKWFKRFRKAVNETISNSADKLTNENVFHSFRHTVQTEFLKTNYTSAEKDLMCSTMGWQFDKKTMANYYGQYSLQNAKNLFEKVLTYRDLDLSHLYVKQKCQ